MSDDLSKFNLMPRNRLAVYAGKLEHWQCYIPACPHRDRCTDRAENPTLLTPFEAGQIEHAIEKENSITDALVEKIRLLNDTVENLKAENEKLALCACQAEV